jgi:hypothetical protein
MKDIVKAMAKEQEYLEYRKKGEEPFHLVDAVKECGFDDLNDYFNEKTRYKLAQLPFEIIETTPARAIADVMDCIDNKKSAVLFAVTPYTLIWNGTNSPFNEIYCEEHKIPIYPLYTGGGTIVSTFGDLNIGICVPRSAGVDSAYFLNGIANILRHFTNQTISVDRNDVLVGGKKILGSSAYTTSDMFVFITPISMSEKNDLIDCICIKKSSKAPSHINFMNANTLREEVEEWLQVRST